MRIPLTGSILSDLGLVALAFVIGLAIALKADMKWGYVLVLLSVGWGWFVVRAILHAQ
jgi:hypothetical protein